MFQGRCEFLLYVCALWPRVLLSSWPHASPLCHLHSSLLLIHLQNCFCHDAMWWGGSPSTEGVHPWPCTYITHSNKNWRLPPHPFFSTSLTLSLSLFQGQSKERGEPAADQVQERSVEGGLGGPVWSQTLHHYHRGEQEQRRQSRVSQQPPTLKAAFEQLLQMLILFQSGSVKDGNICLPRQRTKGHNKVLTLRN